MDEGVLESMVQDGDTEQEMLVVEEQELPQTDPEPEMGAAAAVAYDTSPPLPHQNPPPIPAGTVHPSIPDMAQVCAMLAGVTAAMQQMQEQMKNKMDAHTQAFINDAWALRGEMRQVGQCLQAGKTATPRAGTNELKGSATAVRPAVEAGEDRVIRETCWGRNCSCTIMSCSGVSWTMDSK